MNAPSTDYLPRDYVETAPGLFFAVVAHGMEAGRVLGCLRYVRNENVLCKLGTDEANELLRQRYPEYLFHSPQRDVWLHGVLGERIATHFKPRERMTQILQSGVCDRFEQRVARVARTLGIEQPESPWLGVTGSVLIGAHHERSDIDLVVYDSAAFQQVRARLQIALKQGGVQPLDDATWHATYQRRGCSLTFDQYLWHEQRKLNKFVYEGTKVDLSYVGTPPAETEQRGKKLELRILQGTVVDDSQAFDHAARYLVDHGEIPQIVSYNPTYTGQARQGETVEAAGWVERLGDGQLRLLVGTTREAPGEYIRVTHGSS